MITAVLTALWAAYVCPCCTDVCIDAALLDRSALHVISLSDEGFVVKLRAERCVQTIISSELILASYVWCYRRENRVARHSVLCHKNAGALAYNRKISKSDHLCRRPHSVPWLPPSILYLLSMV